MPINRVALYARISTNDGRQQLENQLIQLREFAGRMKWTITHEFTDQMSGRTTTRPGLEKLLKAAARRSFDTVLVFDLSRLTRAGIGSAFEIVTRLQSSRIEFWSMTQEIFRTTGPTGTFMIACAAYIAQEETEANSRRVIAGLERARTQGRIGGQPRKKLNVEKLKELYKNGQGATMRELAKRFKVSPATIERRINDKSPGRTRRPNAFSELAGHLETDPEKAIHPGT